MRVMIWPRCEFRQDWLLMRLSNAAAWVAAVAPLNRISFGSVALFGM